jgi:hypothetical protein
MHSICRPDVHSADGGQVVFSLRKFAVFELAYEFVHGDLVNDKSDFLCVAKRRVDATDKLGDLTYLVTDQGRSFTINGLGNKMREWCDAAGLPQCSSHGLRKAAAVILAENGATAPELCALFGWSKLETAEIYIREAQKREMVWNAFARLDEYRNRKSVSVSGSKDTNETNKRKSRAKTKPV